MEKIEQLVILDGRIIVSGGEFEGYSLWGRKNLVVSGGKFGPYVLWACENPVISGGEFGPGALRRCKNPVVSGGEFGPYTLWACENPVISGGEFGPGALWRCENVHILNTEGYFKSIYRPYSGIVVAKRIEEIIKLDYLSNVRIYAVNSVEGAIRISSEQLEKIAGIVSKAESFQSGLEIAVREVVGE